VLSRLVRDRFETFRLEAARLHERDGLPRFIEEEFRGFLRCGFLAGGFARFHCGRMAGRAAAGGAHAAAADQPSALLQRPWRAVCIDVKKGWHLPQPLV
jgi:hypothetical protein